MKDRIMLVFLFAFIYLAFHCFTFHIMSKLTLAFETVGAGFAVSYYIALFIAPVFLLLVTLIASGNAGSFSLNPEAHIFTACLALILLGSCISIISGLKKDK